MAARLADDAADFFLRVAVIVDETLVSLGLLDGVQVLTLHVFDERDLEGLLVGERAHQPRPLVELRRLRRAPAPLAGNDLAAPFTRPPHPDRRSQALAPPPPQHPDPPRPAQYP